MLPNTEHLPFGKVFFGNSLMKTWREIHDNLSKSHKKLYASNLFCIFFFSEKLLSHYRMASTQIYISLLLVSSLVALGKIDLIIQ